ncbi:MAG: NAD(P)/FAD-dependent oxidoreductase [Candidatus Bathyarchaeia archaeon]
MRYTNILVLGGGIGGVVSANLLRKKLGEEHRIVLVDRKTRHEFCPSYPYLMMGWREPDHVTKDLSLLKKKNIDYVNGKVLKIDPADRSVETSSGDHTYDYLIIALGAELTPDIIPGLSDAAYHVYELEDALRLREALKAFSGGTVAIGISKPPFRCPAAPFETALLMDYYFRLKGIREKVDLQFFNPGPLPLGVAGPKIGKMVVQMLESRDISFHPSFLLSSVDSKKGEITSEKGEKMKFDLLFAIPPHQTPKVVREAGLTDETGWIPVDKKTLKTEYDDVYALGDVTKIMLAMGKPLPKAGVFAHYQAEVVAQNIAVEIQGTGEEREFKGDGTCLMEVGFGKAIMVRGNFYAEPTPNVKVQWPKVSRLWHWSKVMWEKLWFWRWF